MFRKLMAKFQYDFGTLCYGRFITLLHYNSFIHNFWGLTLSCITLKIGQTSSMTGLIKISLYWSYCTAANITFNFQLFQDRGGMIKLTLFTCNLKFRLPYSLFPEGNEKAKDTKGAKPFTQSSRGSVHL